jgi:WD40 repeat protein
VFFVWDLTLGHVVANFPAPAVQERYTVEEVLQWSDGKLALGYYTGDIYLYDVTSPNLEPSQRLLRQYKSVLNPSQDRHMQRLCEWKGRSRTIIAACCKKYTSVPVLQFIKLPPLTHSSTSDQQQPCSAYPELVIGHGCEGHLLSMYLLADNDSLATCFRSGIVRLWDLEKRSCVRELDVANDYPDTSGELDFALLPNGMTIMSGAITEQPCIKFWG